MTADYYVEAKMDNVNRNKLHLFIYRNSKWVNILKIKLNIRNK